jgi:peptide/nickel transport system permease protein
LFGLSVVLFLYLQLIPGDPIAGMLGSAASPKLVAELRHEFGLDQPVLLQYFNWVTSLAHGDLGISFASRQPIAPILVARIPATLQLTIGGMLFALTIGLPMGFFAGLHKNSPLDRVLSFFALVGLSSPTFWVATILVLVFAVELQWLPSQGYVPLVDDPVSSIRYTLLPAFTLGFGLAPYLARMTRAATVSIREEPFIAFADSKGLKRSTIVLRYFGRNVVPAVVIVLGLQLGALIGGQVLVETIFGWPGVGRLLVDGVVQRDYFMVQAVVLIMAVVVVVLNLTSELVQGWLDPRIRFT